MDQGRRRFLGLLSLLIAMPHARAQRRSMQEVGLLWVGSAETAKLRLELVAGLADAGFVEGVNFVVDDRTSTSRYEELDEVAKRLAERGPDVVVAYGATATRAIRNATSTIPIVVVTGGDPVRLGFVQSLSHPGTNVTGLTMLGDEVTSKRIELLREALPRARKLAIMFNPASPAEAASLRIAQDAASSIGFQSYPIDVRAPEALEATFSKMSELQIDALLIVGSTMLFAYRGAISELAQKYSLPAMSSTSEYAEAGTLLAYGPDVAYTFRQASTYVARILRGARPRDLPFEQSTKVMLVVNLRAARALGLEIPRSILLRADRLLP